MADRYLLVLWLTSRCNLRCSYCYAGACGTGRDLDFETARTAIDRLRQYPLKIQFAGGEPLLNLPLAEKICTYVRQQGLDAVFQLQTNGTLLTEETARTLRRLSISVGVSLDGIPAVNERTRGRTAQAVEGIRQLGRQGMAVGLNAVVTAETVEQLPKLVDFAWYLGCVGGIGLDLLRHAGRGCGSHDASPAQLRTAMEAMAARSRELERLSGRKIELRELELAKKRLRQPDGPRYHCYAACGRSAVVRPDGRVYPCGSLCTEEYAMGTAETLNPGSLRTLRSPDRTVCTACPYRPFCPGGCPSRCIKNETDLDCVLLKTAFRLAEQETDPKKKIGGMS